MDTGVMWDERRCGSTVIPSLQLKTFVQYSRYKADIDAGVFADENDYGTISNSYLNGVEAPSLKGIE